MPWESQRRFHFPTYLWVWGRNDQNEPGEGAGVDVHNPILTDSVRRITFSITLALAVSLAARSAAASPQGSQKKDSAASGIVTNTGVAKVPPPLPDTATTLTFYENSDRTGATYSVQLQPPPLVYATRQVTTAEITSAGLYGKVSAVRIQCGTRASRAALFDIDWGEFSSGYMIQCLPNQTSDVNLVNVTNPRTLDNKINAAALVDHVRSPDGGTHSLPLSFPFKSVWLSSLKAQLPGSATVKDTWIWLDDFQNIHIQQFLQLDSKFCTARTASFEIRITLSTKGFAPVFTVIPVSQNVDGGFGDLWGCHSGMVSGLADGVKKIVAGLNQALPGFITGTDSNVYYFAPGGSTQDFDVFFWASCTPGPLQPNCQPN